MKMRIAMRSKTQNRFRQERSRAARPAALIGLGAVLVAGLSGWNLDRAGASAEDPEKPAVIDFVTLGGIRDWRPQGNDAVLIQGIHGTWYRATFLGPCPGLQFRQSVAFVTDGTDQLNRFSSLLVDGQRCWFRTFERTEAPGAGASPGRE